MTLDEIEIMGDELTKNTNLENLKIADEFYEKIQPNFIMGTFSSLPSPASKFSSSASGRRYFEF